MKRKNNENNSLGITLISLVITIIVLIILAGIAISLNLGKNGIFEKAKEAKNKTEELQAKEKLEVVLLDIQIEKQINNEYNKNEYITNKIEEQGMIVLDNDIVIVDEWIFQIDRENIQISESLGKYKNSDNIEGITLNKQKIIIGITTQENINIDKTANIEVATQGIEKWQYKWNIKDKDIATIDSNGKITAIKSGETQIECKSIDGKDIYAICELKVEEREYIYYNGKTLIEFENPICGENAILLGTPYFMTENIYAKVSNEKFPNERQLVNFLSKEKIDFSKYKGIGIKQRINTNGKGGENWVDLVQDKTCNSWGLISPGEPQDRFYIELISREDGIEYGNTEEYNNMAYLDNVMNVGEYQSGVTSTVEIYIYEIFLVK